jgi:hypothetical protein
VIIGGFPVHGLIQQGDTRMIRHYCCGALITNHNGFGSDRTRLTGEIPTTRCASDKYRFEVVVSENSIWNKGDFCKYCVLDALYVADDRLGENAACASEVEIARLKAELAVYENDAERRGPALEKAVSAFREVYSAVLREAMSNRLSANLRPILREAVLTYLLEVKEASQGTANE